MAQSEHVENNGKQRNGATCISDAVFYQEEEEGEEEGEGEEGEKEEEK